MLLFLLSCAPERPLETSTRVLPYTTLPPPSSTETDCMDGRDNDLDQRTDCADPDCADAAHCFEAICTDNADNDGDGLVDCQDPDCRDVATCAEAYKDNCFDGLDNDHNGLVDCEDSACTERIGCIEACTTEEDDDGDGLLNCADADCWGVRSCQSYTAVVVAGRFSSTARWSQSTRDRSRRVAYASHPDLGTVQTYALYSTAFRRVSTTVTTDLVGTLQVTSPLGAQASCGFTLGGRWFRDSSSGTQRSQSSVVFTTSGGACNSHTQRSSDTPSPSVYRDFNAGRPAFSSGCSLPESHQWLDLEAGPFLASRTLSDQKDTTTPQTLGPTPFTGICGYAGERSTTSSLRWVTRSSGVSYDFGAQPQSWRFGQPE